MQRAVALGLLLDRDDGRQDLGLGLLVALLGPRAATDQVALQPQHRIAQRPGVGLRLRPVGRGIVRGGMGADAIGHVLDQGRPEIAARPLDRPFRHGMDGEIVVAVDPQRRDAEAQAARREGARAAAGDALEGRDRPLVVDDVEHDRRLVGRGEDEGGVEVRFGGRAVADPARRDPGVALHRRRHRPADRLDVLRGEVARDREEAVLARRIHHRQLAALQRIELVRVDLVHHVEHRDSRRRSAARPGGRSGSSCRRARAPRGRRSSPPPRPCAACRTTSCPGAGPSACAHRRRAASSCGAGPSAAPRRPAGRPTDPPPRFRD